MAWEHSLSPRRALKLYSKAVRFSAFVSLALVMEGFDTKVVGSLYSVPAFQKDFGSRTARGNYEISAAWQSGMSGITGVSVVLGMLLGGYASERFGFRKTMMAALISMPPIVFIFFFAPSLQVLAVAYFLFCRWPCKYLQPAELTSPSLATWNLPDCHDGVHYRDHAYCTSPLSHQLQFTGLGELTKGCQSDNQG